MRRWALPLAIACACASGVASPAEAAKPEGVTASMTCEHALEPGRVRCSAEAIAAPGKALDFADLALVGLPPFAMALKGRLGREDATARESDRVAWAFGLVARRTGQGDAVAAVRVVLCDVEDGGSARGRCVPVVLEVHATVQVGN